MPPIFLHMAMARDIRDQVAEPLLGERAGAYFFGATTPDIRVLTRRDRRETHFFDLDVFDHQDSVAAMFAAYPKLARCDELDRETAAFVAGYITHLTLDEVWITDVYRPCFGARSPLAGDPQGDVMDRLLQYELDRRRREDDAFRAEAREALEACSLAIDVDFLDSETLTRWLQVAVEQTQHPPNWERFWYQGGRHLRHAGISGPDDLRQLMERIPELLEATLDHVSTARVDAYLEGATDRARAVAERYLRHC